MRNAVLNGYNSPHTLDQNRNLRVIFGITALDFHQSSASLSFRFINVSTRRNNPNPPKFLDFDLAILNETVIYRLRVDVAIIQEQDIDEIYIQRTTYTCQVINQGIGYRSENYTFPTSVKSSFDPQVRQVYAALYYRGFNLFNPNGSSFYLNWQFHYNHTHYTLVFHTQDENLVSFIDFSLILVDLNNAYEKMGYRRTFAIDMLNCSNSSLQSCPGKSQWTADPLYQPGFESYLFGLTKLNFTKHQRTNWYFDSTDITNLVQNYIETNSLKWANMTVFIVGKVDCQPSSKAFDPQTKTCVSNCASSGSQYFISQNGGTGEKFCRKCYYACTPGQCNNQQANQCNACNTSKFRQADSGGGSFRCNCMTGYIDAGLQLCRSCSYYIPGCLQCSSTTTCTLCGSNMRITSNGSCQCTMVQTTSRYGTCQGIVGCLVYFNDPIRSTVCIQCNITQNFVLYNYTCDCVVGYQLKSIGGKWVCTLTQVCGDGIRTINQQCDDFNTFNKDGCNSTCRVEIGYLCFGNLRQTSFCIENKSTLQYVGAMKIQGQTTADFYFQLWPYNQRLEDVGILSKYLQTSINNISSMKNLQIFTQPNHVDDKLRIRLRYDYTQDVNTSIQHNLTIQVFDRQKQYKLQSKFYIVGNNLKLTMVEAQNNFAPLNYVMLVLVILAFVALIISLFKQNWISIELLHTFQFCFFYYLLLQNIDEKQYKFLNFLQFCNGFNRISDFISYYEYADFNRKIYLMDFRKEILVNFNFTTLIFSLPILLVLWKTFRKFCNCQKKSKKFRGTTQSTHQRSRKSYLDYILSSEFIIGKVFITLNLTFMNVILFSFFIQQTSFLQENQVFNGIFQQFYLFVLLTSVIVTVGLLILSAVKPYRYDEVSTYEDEDSFSLVKSKRFIPTYPIIYTTVVGMKIIFIALFVNDNYSPYILLSIETVYFIGFLIIKPYRKIRFEQSNYCYLLHNLHNLWNSFGLIILIVVIIVANTTKNYSSYSINAVIKFIIFSVQLISLILAYLRLFMSKRLASSFKDTPQKPKEKDKTFDFGYGLQDTDRTLRKNGSNVRKGSIGQRSQAKSNKVSEQKTSNLPRKLTGISSIYSSPNRIRQF